MKQMESDSSLWLVLAAVLCADGVVGVVEIVDEKGEILAIIGVYVDDLLLSGPSTELDAIACALEGLWKISSPTTVSDGLRFCGLEVNLGSDGAYLLHQTSYLKDLVSRYTLPANSSLPDFRQGYEEEEGINIPVLRRSQKLVGELLWLCGKTRLGQLVPRFPRMVYEDGLRTLAYLARTSTTMLRYGAFDEPWMGENPLRYNRKKITMETWSDASFGQDDSGRSQHGILLVLAGGVVSWHSSKQTLTAQSTAESELIAAVEAMTLGRALGPVWMELCREPLLWSANVDNSACIQLLVVPGGQAFGRGFEDKPKPTTSASELRGRSPSQLPKKAALKESLRLRPPARVTLADPAVIATPAVKAAPRKGIEAKATGSKGEKSEGKRAKGKDTTPRAEASPQTTRLILDYHGVLDLEEPETLRRGRKSFAPDGGVTSPVRLLLGEYLRRRPEVEALVLSYMGKFSYDKRRGVLESIQSFSQWLEGRGVRNKVSLIICDTRDQKAEIAGPLEPAVAVDDGYEIVESYSRKATVHRSVWLDSLYDPRTGPAVPRNITWAKKWQQILEIVDTAPGR
ncbi:TY5A [Symbiodinium sp. KB8]|nr:TY5A [Symbiodinium sp. KB8]